MSPRARASVEPGGAVPAVYGQSHTTSYPDVRDYTDTASSIKPEEPTHLLLPAGRQNASEDALPADWKKIPSHYTVVRGDTLFSIGRRYGTTVETLKAANGLKSDAIFPGDVLTIPGG